MKKILLTGFEPFGPDKVNPSWEAVALLPKQMQGVSIARRKMPVEYDRVAPLLEEAIREEQPDAVICVGQGPWEIPDTTYHMKNILESKGIHTWVDVWGHDCAHDWPWWYKQVAYFLPWLLGQSD